MRLKKEGHCRTYKGYQKQLSKAGKVTVECKWMMREADAQLSTYEDDGQLIKQLLARVPGSNIELNRQLHGIREGKQREQGIITASYAHTISQLRFQVQESNAMVLRLRMQLRNKEREIARVRSRDNSISKLRSSSVSSEERSLSFSSLPRQLLKATDALSNSGVSDPHDDVELELRAIAILEKDLEELTAQRRKLRESVDNRRAPKDGLRDAWKLVKLFESTPQQGKRFTRCENTSGERRVVNHNRSGGPIKNVTVVSHPPKSLSKAEGRLGEVERNINSLLEAHRYHVQRLQRLRQGGLSASSPYVESGSGAPSSLMAGELLSDSPSG
ncbi:hypothetical protein ERJ75_001657200 [Trypanosoma vivax]|nr:hypothetical protein ERJ75_001657200 [Trypanosoma vivax]